MFGETEQIQALGTLTINQPEGEFVGIKVVGDMPMWEINCPCRISVKYGINELPTVSTLHPCGNPKHWTIKYERAN